MRFVVLAVALSLTACRAREASADAPVVEAAPPSVRTQEPAEPQRDPFAGAPHATLLVVTDWSGVLKPCGCTIDLQRGGVERVARFVEEMRLRDAGALLVHAGPLLHAREPILTSRIGQARRRVDAFVDISQLVALDVAAASVGDLERDRVDVARRWRSGSLPLLATNWFPPGPGGDLVPMPTRKLVRSPSGVQVGFFALEPPDAMGPAHAEVSGFVAKDPIVTARATIAELKAEGAEIVVLLSNLGPRQTRRLARGVSGLDVAVVGGFGDEPPRPDDLDREGQTLLVHAGRHGAGVGVLRLVRRGDGPFVDASAWDPGAPGDLKARVASLEADLKRWRGGAQTVATRMALPHLEAELHALRTRVEEARTSPSRPLPAGNLVSWRLEPLPWSQPVSARAAAIVARYDADLPRLNASAPPPAPTKGDAGYVGSTRCLGCHEALQAYWKEDRHPFAWKALERDGKTADLDCVPCHSTGYGKPGGSTIGHMRGLEAVGCEGCHGPGSLHATSAESGRPTSILRSPAEATCRQCHTSEHSPRFDFAPYRAMLRRDGHGSPAPGRDQKRTPR